MELSIINKKLAMDSRDIATLTHKKHKNILRDIRDMYVKLGRLKNELTYLDSQGKTQPYYLLDYEDTITLLTGYSVKLRSVVVKRWIYLEKNYKSERKKSMETRCKFTDELQGHGYTKAHEYIQTTNSMKQILGITHKKDEMSVKELKAITASEAMASLMLDDEYGFKEVNPVCKNASSVVVNALVQKSKTLLA